MSTATKILLENKLQKQISAACEKLRTKKYVLLGSQKTIYDFADGSRIIYQGNINTYARAVQ